MRAKACVAEGLELISSSPAGPQGKPALVSELTFHVYETSLADTLPRLATISTMTAATVARRRREEEEDNNNKKKKVCLLGRTSTHHESNSSSDACCYYCPLLLLLLLKEKIIK